MDQECKKKFAILLTRVRLLKCCLKMLNINNTCVLNLYMLQSLVKGSFVEEESIAKLNNASVKFNHWRLLF